jgi:hypothetical protein
MTTISARASESCSMVPEMPPKKAPMYSDSMVDEGDSETREVLSSTRRSHMLRSASFAGSQ